MELAKRFVDNGDGTVTDLETKLIWKQTDSFQDTSKWNNWFRAHEYIHSLNIEKFAGCSDWRMPTLEEAESLHDENHCIKDMDRMDIFISSAFPQAEVLLLGLQTKCPMQPRPFITIDTVMQIRIIKRISLKIQFVLFVI